MQDALKNPEMARMIRDAVGHARDNTYRQADGIARVPASNFTDEDYFQKERHGVFRRVPLMLAASCELAEPGDFKTMKVAGVPVLIIRGQDGIVRAFLNSCTHRGAAVATTPRGNGKRFMCVYHGWTYDQKGALAAISSASDFGATDKSCMGLKAFPTVERAGLIFVTLDENPKVDVDAYLSGFDELLKFFSFDKWHFFDSAELKSANWKLAYDASIDYYHVPVLHKDTLAAGGAYSNRALYYPFGPHQRMLNPDSRLKPLAFKPEDEWTAINVTAGNWAIFPNVTFGVFNGGFADSYENRRATLVSQVFPGDTPGTSITNLLFLTDRPPETEEAKQVWSDQFMALQKIVDTEDNYMGFTQQQALDTGLVKELLYGRNEGGMQSYHAWVEKIARASDRELADMFTSPQPAAA